MSVVKINAITVPEGRGHELEERFAHRAAAVENAPGFEGFELLRPVEGESRYFVYTRGNPRRRSRTGSTARISSVAMPRPTRNPGPRLPWAPPPTSWPSRWS